MPLRNRDLTTAEQALLQEIRRAGLDIALLHLTRIGLSKSILDATEPIREMLARGGVHHYQQQPKGQANKVSIDAHFLSATSFERRRVTLYRPETKDGDPRLWVARLGELARPDDLLGVHCRRGELTILNLTALSALHYSAARERLAEVTRAHRDVAAELLDRLKALSDTPIPATTHGDTAVGRAVETALGITINSSKLPDYEHIEIKSHRTNRVAKRLTLFAQVPQWDISRVKSSRELLERYGYTRSGIHRLCCEVSTQSANSQGLRLAIDVEAGTLAEAHSIDGNVCKWRLGLLHDRLLSKHKETFWISATEVLVGGQPHFRIRSIRHTQAPSILAFDRLLGEGAITVDHLIKKHATRGVVEKGPLFKIEQELLNSLFLGRISEYRLTG